MYIYKNFANNTLIRGDGFDKYQLFFRLYLSN